MAGQTKEAGVELCEIHLDQRRRLLIATKALDDIRRHMETVVGTGHRMSTIWHLANRAMKEITGETDED